MKIGGTLLSYIAIFTKKFLYCWKTRFLTSNTLCHYCRADGSVDVLSLQDNWIQEMVRKALRV